MIPEQRSATGALPPRAKPLARPGLLLFLGGLTSLTAMSVDISLPAIPGLADLFSAHIAQTHAIVSLFLLGYALMQPIYGPWSDLKGRKPVLLAGLIIFWGAGIACLLAQSIEQLYLARFIQGIGAGCGPVLARAILRDCYEGKQAEKAMAMVIFMMALGPMIAPIIGSHIIALWGVMAVFGVLVIIASLACIITLFWFRETAVPAGAPTRPKHILTSYQNVWHNRRSRYNMLAGGFVYASMLCYISASPAVLIEGMGIPASAYGYYFAISATALLVGAFLNNRLLHAFSIGPVTFFGAASAIIGAVVMLVGALLDIRHAYAVVGPAAATVFGLAIVLPNTTVQAMAPFRQIAGTASAAIGSMQITIGLVLGFIAGAFFDGTARPMAWSMGLAAGLMVVFLILARTSPGDDSAQSS